MNKYITKKAIKEPWELNPDPPKSFYRFIIVIPSYNEGYEIIPTLESITLQDMELQKKLLVVFVINNSDDANDQTIKQNKFTSRGLLQFECNFDICTIDAYQENPLPKKQAGVGLARKIGFDLALPYSSKNTILCGLDADTIISPDYLNTIDIYFINQKIDCLIPEIKHQNGATIDMEKAIRDYEDFLYSTAENLQKAGSPYGFVTMGSAMAFTPYCYMKAGGISRKKATEDFYFLQEVVKTTSVITIPEILVHPSARVSDRVYLGTGFRMRQAQMGYELTDLKYTEKSFLVLKDWLVAGENSYKISINGILKKAEKIDFCLKFFLIEKGIKKIWSGLQASSSDKEKFKHQFHCWFDGLKTHRLLKYFSTDPSSFAQ